MKQQHALSKFQQRKIQGGGEHKMTAMTGGKKSRGNEHLPLRTAPIPTNNFWGKTEVATLNVRLVQYFCWGWIENTVAGAGYTAIFPSVEDGAY